MLSYFVVQNFKSILDLKLDLSFAEGKAPNHYEELQIIPFVGDSARFVPVLAMYGANASGKTNVLQALFVLIRILQVGVAKFYNPNKLNPKYNATTFEIGVQRDKTLYIYSVAYNQYGILHEVLYKNDKEHMLFEIKDKGCLFDQIATKEYTVQRLEEIYRVECQNGNGQQWLPFLTVVARNYLGLNQELVSVFNQITRGIEVYSENNIPLPYVLDKLAKEQSQTAITAAFDKITSILKKLDININKLTWDRKYQQIEDPTKPLLPLTDDDTTFYRAENNNTLVTDNIRSYHTDINGNEIAFNFNEESAGTITLSGLIGLCLSALENGKTLCIDELDKSLHSHLLIEIVRMFKDRRYNTTNAQLIFTAHNTDILDDDLMRVSEIAVINKTEKNGTTIKRVSDFEGKRNVTNFRKQYLAGIFSGVPYPYI